MSGANAQPNQPGAANAAKVGIGFGAALAITISWSANKFIR